MAYSIDDGASWVAPRFASVAFDWGATVLNEARAILTNTPPAGIACPATNCFSLVWDTRHPSNNLHLAMHTLVRVSASDPLFPAVSALGGPFAVDNEAPVVADRFLEPVDVFLVERT